MLVFLDESFRRNTRNNADLACLCGVGVPEPTLPDYLQAVYEARKGYHGVVLGEDDELKGKYLLNRPVLNEMDKRGYSYKWNLVEELLQVSLRHDVIVFGVVNFDPRWRTLVSADETSLDQPFRRLFQRIDSCMKRQHVGQYAKLIFDNRQHAQNAMNSRAITNFLTRSTLGSSFDTIIKVPFFGVSEAQNYGLQMADIVTTVVSLKFAGERRIDPLWRLIKRMLYRYEVDGRGFTTLAVLRARRDAHKNESGGPRGLWQGE